MKRYILLNDRPKLVLWFCIVLYWLIFSALSLWKLSNFYYDNLDLAIFNQVFWNTANGSLFATTIHPPSYLADHFTPVLLIVTLLYRLFPGPEFLLVFQSIVIGLTALPIFYISRKVLSGSLPWLPLIPALMWLVNPIVHNMNLFEFHLLPIAVLFIFFVIYAYLTERRISYVLLFILALIVREDVALMLGFFSIIALIHKRSLFWILFPFLASVSYAAIAFPLISVANPAGVYKFSLYYGWLGGTSLGTIILSFIMHPLRVIQHVITFSNFEMIIGLLFPFFFTISFYSPFLLLLVAPLAQVLLGASGGGALIIQTHYGGYLLIGTFIAFIYALRSVEKGQWSRLAPKVLRKREALYGIVVFASLYSAATYGVITPVVHAWNTSNQMHYKRELLAQIPANAAVATTFELLTPLSSRSNVYSLHYALIGKNQFGLTDYSLPQDTEYIAIDWNDMVKTTAHFQSNERFAPYFDDVAGVLQSILNKYSPIYARNSLILLSRNADTEPVSVMYSENIIGVTPQASIIFSDEEKVVLEISISDAGISLSNYYLEISNNQDTFMLPLGYGVLPTDQTGGTIQMEIFIPESDFKQADVNLKAWSEAFIKLGDLRNIELVTQDEVDVSVSDMIR